MATLATLATLRHPTKCKIVFKPNRRCLLAISWSTTQHVYSRVGESEWAIESLTVNLYKDNTKHVNIQIICLGKLVSILLSPLCSLKVMTQSWSELCISGFPWTAWSQTWSHQAKAQTVAILWSQLKTMARHWPTEKLIKSVTMCLCHSSHPSRKTN